MILPSFDHLRINPRPVQAHMPVMIGGGGERKTLRIVARHADVWNVCGTPEQVARRDGVLRAHCAEIERDPAAIERTLGCKITIRATEAGAVCDTSFWTGTAEQITETIIEYRRAGFYTFINELAAPYDLETMETLMTVVKPMVEGVPLPA